MPVVHSVEAKVRITDTVDGKQQVTTVNTPASAAGLHAGDRIRAIQGEEIDSWEQVQRAIKRNGGHRVNIDIERDGRPITLTTTLLANGPKGVGYLGISPEVKLPRPGLLASIGLAPVRTAEVLGDTVKGFGHIFSPSGISDYLSNFNDKATKSTKAQQDAQNARFISPVGITGYASDAVEAGWASVFGLLIAINVSIGFINLLPLIPFDGGHIAVAIYEAIMTKVRRQRYRVDFAKLMPVAVATLSILAFIFLSSLFLDIAHPVANPF
jgi:membrane-associated protease RseP (regulator of RpoE activity)